MDLKNINLSGLSASEIDNLLVELERVQRLSPLDYVPHDKQRLFHCASQPIRAVTGGNRSGKTECGSLETWFHMSGEYPEWYPRKGRLGGHNLGRIIISEYKNHGSVLEAKIRKWFPSDRAVIKRSMGHIDSIEVKHRDGGISRAEILTHEQDDKSFESWSGHWAWFDEPPPYEKYVATMRGLVDFGGRCWLTLTPLNEPWIYDEINKTDGRRWSIVISIFDNPHLTKEYIETFISTMDEDSKEARLHGKFRHLAGLVYKEFDPSVHLLPLDKTILCSGWPTWFVLDPADRRPHHGIWAKCDPLGTIYIFDELVFKGTIKDTSKEILAREKLWEINSQSVIRILDPNKGRTPSAVSGMTLVQEFGLHKTYFSVNVNDDRATGHLAVKELLSWNKKEPFSSTNCPKMYFIEENTRQCVKQVQSYVWEDWKGVSKGARSEKEDVKDINKDMPDCLRYLAVSKPTYYNINDNNDPTPFKSTGVTGYK